VGGVDQTNLDVFAMAAELVQDAYQVEGDRLADQAAQQTDGVHWKIQTIMLGASPVSRWFSQDYLFPAGFLFIPQKVEGQQSGKKLIALMGKTLMRQSLKLYGFDDDQLPGLDQAEVLEFGQQRLQEDFMGFASDPAAARRLITPGLVTALESWAARHPINKGVTREGNFQQLVILFSPEGVFLCSLGTLKPGETEELVELGVELVRAQLG
jgi:hypothetical protein